MFISKTIKFFCVGLICVSATLSTAFAKPMRVTMMLEHEGFLLWYAMQQGWDQELGLELSLNIKNLSGADILNITKDAKNWDVAAIGAVPLAICSKNLPITAFAIANDESQSTEIFVKSDSSILKKRGYNHNYPNIYGSPESVRGKTFFIRENTSSFYTLMTWVKIIGLNFKEINFKNVAIADMVQDFSQSNAEGLVAWSPITYDAIRNGYAHVASADDLHLFLPVVFCTPPDYAEQHAEDLSKLLSIYYRASQEQKFHLNKMTKAYKKFLKTYTGDNFSEAFCKFDLQRHRLLSLDEQIDYFKDYNGQSKIMGVRSQILTIFRDVAAAYNWNDTYDEKDYPATATTRYLVGAKKYLQ